MPRPYKKNYLTDLFVRYGCIEFAIILGLATTVPKLDNKHKPGIEAIAEMADLEGTKPNSWVATAHHKRLSVSELGTT
ncbi:MAG: hypothetical protein AB7U29_11800 [Desulfobulbus sp.]